MPECSTTPLPADGRTVGEVTGFFPPEPLAENHEFESLRCGEASLDDWLKRRARANQVSGASRTYVVCKDKLVIGYYALASGVVMLDFATALPAWRVACNNTTNASAHDSF